METEILFEVQCVRCDELFNVDRKGSGTTTCPHCKKMTTYFVYVPERSWDKDISKEEQNIIERRLFYSEGMPKPIFTTIFHTDKQLLGVIDFLKSINPDDFYYTFSYLAKDELILPAFGNEKDRKRIIVFRWNKITGFSQDSEAIFNIYSNFIVGANSLFRNCAIFFLVNYEHSPTWLHSAMEKTVEMNHVWLEGTDVDVGKPHSNIWIEDPVFSHIKYMKESA